MSVQTEYAGGSWTSHSRHWGGGIGSGVGVVGVLYFWMTLQDPRRPHFYKAEDDSVAFQISPKSMLGSFASHSGGVVGIPSLEMKSSKVSKFPNFKIPKFQKLQIRNLQNA